MNIREPTGRLARWAILLQQYDFNIVHRSGRSHGNADALSRRDYDTIIATVDTSGVQTEKIKSLQRKDPALADIIEYLEFEQLPNDSKAAKTLLYTIEQYFLDPDGILCHIWIPGGKRVPTPKSQLVVPASLPHEVLVNAHDLPTGGHLGVNKTYAKLRDRYFWPKMYMDVQHWCLSCEHCAMKKSPKQRLTAPLLQSPSNLPLRNSQRIYVDLCLSLIRATDTSLPSMICAQNGVKHSQSPIQKPVLLQKSSSAKLSVATALQGCFCQIEDQTYFQAYFVKYAF